MKSKEAKAWLEAQEKKLADLQEQRDTATQELQAIQDKRAAVVRALAGGDDKQRKIILDLEAQAAPLALRLEGLSGLINEAQEKVGQAREQLAAVEEKESQELTAYVDANQAESAKAAVERAGSWPGKICQLYREICELAAELHVSESRAWSFSTGGACCLLWSSVKPFQRLFRAFLLRWRVCPGQRPPATGIQRFLWSLCRLAPGGSAGATGGDLPGGGCVKCAATGAGLD